MSVKSLHHTFTKMAEDIERWTKQDARNAGIDVSREDFAGFRNQWERGDSVPRSVVENLAGEKALHTKGLRSMGQHTGAFLGGAGEGISENARGLSNAALRLGSGIGSGIENMPSRIGGAGDWVGHGLSNLWHGRDDRRTEQFQNRVDQRQQDRASTHDTWHQSGSQFMSDDSVFNKNFDTNTMDAGHTLARRAQQGYREQDAERRRGEAMADFQNMNQTLRGMSGQGNTMWDNIQNFGQMVMGNDPWASQRQQYGNQWNNFQQNYGMRPDQFDFNSLSQV